MEDEGDGPAANASPSLITPFNPALLTKFLAALVPVALGATPNDLDSSLFSYPETLQRCAKFATEPSCMALYVKKEATETIQQDDTDTLSPSYIYSLGHELSSSPTTAASLALIKRSIVLDSTIPIAIQLQIVNLPGTLALGNASGSTSPYEILYSLIHHAVAPYFDTYTKEKEKPGSVAKVTDVESKTGIPVTKKKIAELELSLLHLQQNVEIPEISLNFHPILQAAIEEALSSNRKPSLSLVPQNLLMDSIFLNHLQSSVNSWIKSIQTITKMSRDPSSGTASQEINFWLSMETALEGIDRQLRSDGVILTIEILRQAKRFHATVGFIADTGLKEAIDKVHKYNQLMREFPLNELLSATSLERIQEAILQIFSHLNKKLRICPYPIRRALPLVEAISADLDSQLHTLLSGRRIMHLEFNDFNTLMDSAEDVFRTWDDQIKEFTNVAREVTRKRAEKFIPIKINAKHTKSQERLAYVKAFRRGHEQLQQTIKNVLTSTSPGDFEGALDGISDIDAIEEVTQAFAALKDANVLDVSAEGTEAWVAAENTYNERISRVENTIIARLRDRLGKSRTANEMFRVFSKFNALFVRPKIRGAIQEYQTQLIENVKADIASLHDRFKQQYGNSEAHAMAQLHDIPPVSGAIIWARQIERQLNTYMKRVEDVLGKGWALYAEGQKLQNESSIFRKKLETRPIYESWLHEVSRRNLAVNGRIFNIIRNRSAGNTLELVVNFEPQVIALFKEVRNLLWLNFQVPHAITNVSKEAKRVYPYAVTLMETVRTYAQTVEQIQSTSDISMLLAERQTEIQGQIAKGINLKWDSFVHSFDAHLRPLNYLPNGSFDAAGAGYRESRHVQFVRDFAATVSDLKSKTDLLIAVYEKVQSAIAELRTCAYAVDDFEKWISVVQSCVDQLNLENFSNLYQWVQRLNENIGTILLDRLKSAIDAWVEVFSRDVNGDISRSNRNHRKEEAIITEEVGIEPKFSPLHHEICIRNQLIYVDPPLEYARERWLVQLQRWISVICNLQKLQASRYEISVNLNTSVQQGPQKFDTLIPDVTQSHLFRSYTAIENRLREASLYIDKWLQFQSLWDLQAEQVYNVLDENLSRWLQILLEIRKSRSTFDTSDVSKTFGFLVVDFEQVQGRVNAKYDSWQRDILLQFANKLGNRMREFLVEVLKARNDLEQQSLETSSTASAVSFITTVQNCKRKTTTWAPEIEIFQKGQTALSRQRYQFPKDWLFVEQVEGDWAALKEILGRKNRLVQEQLGKLSLDVVSDFADALEAKINAEHKVVNERIQSIVVEWNENKPIAGNLDPSEATEMLNQFEEKMTKFSHDSELVNKAKESLDLEVHRDNVLDIVLEEVRDFKSVWSALSTIWKSLSDLRDTPWASVVPRKVRAALDSQLTMVKEMPSRMRQYAAFEFIENKLKQLVKVNTLLIDMKSDAMRERHWINIHKALRPRERISLSALTLGDVWDLDVTRNETIIRDIIGQAQGEMALEEYLKQVRETWTGYVVDLVNYQNKTRLIKGWDDLFAKCGEHISSISAMKNSPYYKIFEEEASSWDDKLNRTYNIFDKWIDVQRQWVYLEGIFTGNADIKQLLPVESSRFQNINTEFLAVMKKVSKSPFVLDILNISNLQKSLDRLAELLGKIQKALGEYLERERSSFPRFYFVGDEDLLELIGNSKDTIRVQKHLKKMFAGLSGLQLSEDSTVILGFTSREGETVTLRREISLIKIPKINDWLGALEHGMKTTLALLLSSAYSDLQELYTHEEVNPDDLDGWIYRYPAQIVVLAMQTMWTTSVDDALLACNKGDLEALNSPGKRVDEVLKRLASFVLEDIDGIKRKKCEHLITEMVHQRDVIDSLKAGNVVNPHDFRWLSHMRFCYNPEGEPIDRLKVSMASAVFDYGYEYLGVADRLVQTPLTDRCFLTLTQALRRGLGGSPHGPAGTGKTESVKALGVQLGKFVLVFCCDDTFDFQAMGRIFLGICQVGAWGCFDEFNRLEERILSAVSQQIQSIQLGLKALQHDSQAQVELIGKSFKIHADTGIFITMNPGYAGRSNLPDNLKKLFRSIAMTKPDKELIAQVMLYSQGFHNAKDLAIRVVPFFEACSKQLSSQSHYDFGLRALKSVLTTSGNIKRARLLQGSKDLEESSEEVLILQSLRETIAPKLVGNDVELMEKIEKTAFPDAVYIPANLTKLTDAIRKVADRLGLKADDSWVTKLLQLYQIQTIHHGVMMVGSSGTGKSRAWRVLLEALQQVEGTEGIHYIIDPKVISKEILYGNLDTTTREWTDGLFTSILRKIIDNVRGEDTKRHWIIFDGDVDPEWVENLNSVLDDNKLLTLPNGERLGLPPSVRIMFEVESLRYATPATVSRCGMVWFSEDTTTCEMVLPQFLNTIRNRSFDDIDDERPIGTTVASNLACQEQFADIIQPFLDGNGAIIKSLRKAKSLDHIMDFTEGRALTSIFSLLTRTCRNILEYNAMHQDFPLDDAQIEKYVTRKLLLDIVWSFSGDCPLEDRHLLSKYVCSITSIELPVPSASAIDYDVSLPSGDWLPWITKVPTTEVDTHSVTQTDVVIPTVDTIRHEEVLYSWLADHRPVLLCGPPGSGKTMTLFSALRKLPDMEVAGLNFSNATTPELVIKVFEQYCEYRKTLNGIMLAPTQVGRWLVIFCDEINLPAPDKYGTQRVISFLRQLVEHNGFWRTSDKAWVSLERIQFVGACNPPTDAGRTPLAHRFLRHSPLVMVDYPGKESLMQIYGAFIKAILKCVPNLRGYSEPLTGAMVDFYLKSQAKFNATVQAHYVYSPRELSRWIRGIYEVIKPLETLTIEGLVRLWAHEALRLFQDRLVNEDERQWTERAVFEIADQHFPGINLEEALRQPILYSNWLSKDYVPVDREQLRDYTKARLKTFCEEELDVPLVLFNDVLDHVLRIDRVFRQPQGHLILIGVSGSGKTTLSRFVAWMNGLKTFQIKVHNKYSALDFDEDLRDVLRRAGCKGEKICFIMDESNVLDTGFLERMNTLLANAEVPGLFEGDELTTLMSSCKENAQRAGLLLDSPEELYRWFTQQIVKNLHVVFTMNPPEGGLSSKAATSPALFNRCVLNWFGDWSEQAFFQVGSEFTQTLDLDVASYQPPSHFQSCYSELPNPPTHRQAVVNAMIYIHSSMHEINVKLRKSHNVVTFLTPRHYLDFVDHYVKLYNEKREDLEEQQRHLNVGLEKLQDTVLKVNDLRKDLAQKQRELEKKSAEANEKLQRMVADQRDAEQKRSASLKIQEDLAVQDEEIAERKKVVLDDLARAEPAVVEAQRSVSSIKKQHLTEVRSMANPPEAVKMAMESVCTLLGNRVDSWKTVQGIIRRDDFITSIVNYDNEKQMTKSLRLKMQSEYLSKPNYNFETVNRASKACGPLVQWAVAQVNYSEILDRVGPLRDEVRLLEEKTNETKAQAQTIIEMINELETSIARYKDEYAVLISETQMLKSEMNRVQSKVDRSLKLLDSLSSERERWESGSRSFDQQISTIAGDSLISAAFLAYAGLYDQHYRTVMRDMWTAFLQASGIKFEEQNRISEYLCTADDKLQWQEQSLPADDLCTENAIMLKRHNRYPLIIDPSGQAVQFLLSQSDQRKLTITSFLDDAFVKHLESALRFGNPILIHDAEYLDPILNHVLNKEYQKTGGRVLIQLGKQEIDFSPAFRLYLCTRDPSATFSPDICGRVTFVNFTTTRSSLQAQCLNEVLKTERPDVDQRRNNLIKSQGEFKLHLRRLEKRLLQALNESQGNILDDDLVIATLETLKLEAAEITRKVSETEGVMLEVEEITARYKPIAVACSTIFVTLEQLQQLNHFYQFSLDYFQGIFQSVLKDTKKLDDISDYGKRVDLLTRAIFTSTFAKTSQALLHEDHLVLALLLAQAAPVEMNSTILDSIMDESISGCDLSTDSERISLLHGKLQVLSRIPGTERITSLAGQNSEEWQKFLNDEFAEKHVSNLLERDATGMAVYFACIEKIDVDHALHSLLYVKIFRNDRLIPSAEKYVATVLGKNTLTDNEYDFEQLVMKEVHSNIPLALCSVPGYDASFKVDNLISKLQMKCTSVAMGSEEGFSQAERAITSAAQAGSWVFLKNIHLASHSTQWLGNLEKRLHGLKSHPNFRLFMTMEISTKVPVSLLRISRILMFEPPPGIKANMTESLRSLSMERCSKQPVERGRLYFLLSWIHAVILERLRYVPLGWSKGYEFNDSDFECAAFVIDTWVDDTSAGRSNLSPDKIPWSAICTLLSQSIYGGRIDEESDQLALDKIVNYTLSSKAFDLGFELVASPDSVKAPEGSRMEQFMQWVRELPERQPPTWLGLPENAERLLLTNQGKAMLSKVNRILENLLDDYAGDS
ncbi:Dynein heavy chain, cytoplasmic [Neolecta irregularis DAH-3]|uniref:Dynein heavy chain, cytoplasmic n=1 Tax=Neolecta irregularis (strain DAH-3) TaxID=1198029 RepID=A0A1U7LI63_NEOID|nr:Dynein heavy chain, cytoplasmic [Neolecta irregularis DAH-3]|eukprot:OLL22334.1 Dynein heavy chain, cytoplasmic [Neolecta irregularis DAH-3]